MGVVSDLAAVQRRIAQIDGAPRAAVAAGSQLDNDFDGVLRRTLAPASPSRAQLDALVRRNAAAWQIDPALITSVIANESAFDPHATSAVGAKGLMQLMPATAASLGVRDPYDPAQNVAGGARYLRSLLERFGGNVRLAVAAYNAGPAAVEKYGGVPPYAETQRYVNNVLGSLQKYRGG